MKKNKRKQSMTLLEIMIVIFIIGIIGSVIGYNMKGSLEEGKAFKTREGSRQIYELLTLEMAKGVKIEDIEKDPKKILKECGMVKNVDELTKDGWGGEYGIASTIDKRDIKVVSQNFINYLQKKKKDKKENLPYWMDVSAQEN